jgi:hypothetical protein
MGCWSLLLLLLAHQAAATAGWGVLPCLLYVTACLLC